LKKRIISNPPSESGLNLNGLKNVEEILQKVDPKEKPLWESFLKEHFVEKHWFNS